MTETVLVRTPIRVTPVLRRDDGGWWIGHLKEYPGIISQARSRSRLIRNLYSVLRDVAREEPETLGLFR